MKLGVGGRQHGPWEQKWISKKGNITRAIYSKLSTAGETGWKMTFTWADEITKCFSFPSPTLSVGESRRPISPVENRHFTRGSRFSQANSPTGTIASWTEYTPGRDWACQRPYRSQFENRKCHLQTENAAVSSGDAAEVGDVQKQPGGVAKEEVGALRMQECPGQTSSHNHTSNILHCVVLDSFPDAFPFWSS